VNLGVLLADRAANASSVWPDAQSKAAPLSARTIRGPEAIRAGHRGEREIQSLAMERTGDNESFPDFVDCIHLDSLPAARLGLRFGCGSCHCQECDAQRGCAGFQMNVRSRQGWSFGFLELTPDQAMHFSR
jgi:hypothetical protein